MIELDRFVDNQRQLTIMVWETRYLFPKPVIIKQDNRYGMLYGVTKSGRYVVIPDDNDVICWQEYYGIEFR